MGTFTLVPAWEILDAVALLLAVITVLFIVRREAHPGSILLEMASFLVLYAAVYENFATLMGWYGYGRVLFRVGNVPLSVPVIEYLVVYTSLRMADHMRMPTWTKPFLAGLSGMLLDFSIDPIAVKLLRVTAEGTIARWSWFPGPADAQIFGEPVYNFSGWMLLCGYAAAMLLLGRWWFRRSGHRQWVGWLYPPLAMIAALGVMVSPLSRFLLWAEPLASKGSASEWVMLGIHLALPTVLLAALWRGKMLRRLTFRENLPIFLVVGVTHAANVVVTVATRTWHALWLVVPAAVLHGVLLLLVARPGAPVEVAAPAAVRAGRQRGRLSAGIPALRTRTR